jgi:hypothetical protein
VTTAPKPSFGLVKSTTVHRIGTGSLATMTRGRGAARGTIVRASQGIAMSPTVVAVGRGRRIGGIRARIASTIVWVACGGDARRCGCRSGGRARRGIAKRGQSGAHVAATRSGGASGITNKATNFGGEIGVLLKELGVGS